MYIVCGANCNLQSRLPMLHAAAACCTSPSNFFTDSAVLLVVDVIPTGQTSLEDLPTDTTPPYSGFMLFALVNLGPLNKRNDES